MRKLTRLFPVVAILALTQLTGCVAHRHYSSVPDRAYNNNYPAQYPQQYQDQTTYQQSQAPYQGNYQDQYQTAATEVAQIVGIRNVGQVTRSGSNGGGAVVGAILGGIIGNQIGRSDDHSSSRRRYDRHDRYNRYERSRDSGGGRAVATIGGAILGGVIGNEIDRSSSTETQVRTEITLRLGNGAVQAVILDNPGQFRVGDRVRVSFQAGRWIIL